MTTARHDRIEPLLDRAAGALLGLAVGDALGMPTQLLTRAEVVRRYGGILDWFQPAPDGHPVAAGLPAGSVTDDTEQALLLARLLVDGAGRVDPRAWARALQTWEAELVRRGSADLLGPSTRRALDAVAAGVPPDQAGLDGDTNGAAMRIAPVGIAVPLDRSVAGVDRLADAVAAVSRVTHGTDVALAGATAVAAAVSIGVGGAGVETAIATAIDAAPAGAARGRPTAAPPLHRLIAAACDAARGVPVADVADLVERRVGTSLATTESVPAAFAVLAAIPDNPWTACRVAASLGGDSDTVAAMVGAVAGACSGASAFPPAARRVIEEVNGLGLSQLTDLAADLIRLRMRGR